VPPPSRAKPPAPPASEPPEPAATAAAAPPDQPLSAISESDTSEGKEAPPADVLRTGTAIDEGKEALPDSQRTGTVIAEILHEGFFANAPSAQPAPVTAPTTPSTAEPAEEGAPAAPIPPAAQPPSPPSQQPALESPHPAEAAPPASTQHQAATRSPSAISPIDDPAQGASAQAQSAAPVPWTSPDLVEEELDEADLSLDDVEVTQDSEPEPLVVSLPATAQPTGSPAAGAPMPTPTAHSTAALEPSRLAQPRAPAAAIASKLPGTLQAAADRQSTAPAAPALAAAQGDEAAADPIPEPPASPHPSGSSQAADDAEGLTAEEYAEKDTDPVAPAEADPPAPEPAAVEAFTGSDLDQVDTFADLPEEMHEALARSARVDDLAPDEELAGFGAALVLRGKATVCTTIVDTPAHHAVIKTLVPSRGTLAEGIPLRVVAGAGGARVAIWDQAIIDEALRTCPWVLDELRATADLLQALAGATMGPLGELEEEPLHRILSRLGLRCLQPEEPIVYAGNPMPGLVVVGAGTIELVEEKSEQVIGSASSGDLLFAAVLLSGQPAPAIARASASGALVLLGEHPVLRELFESTPELIQLLAQES
jgi:hypothetical protein